MRLNISHHHSPKQQSKEQDQQNKEHDRYSVVVLDWPKKEKEDIECYCIPSTKLDGYINPYHDDSREDDVDNVVDDVIPEDRSIVVDNNNVKTQSKVTFKTTKKQPQTEGKGNRRGWNPLSWPRNGKRKQMTKGRAGGRPTSAIGQGKNNTSRRNMMPRNRSFRRLSQRKLLTEEDLMKYVSSNDDLDWSDDDDIHPNPVHHPSSIVQSLVEIYIDEDTKEEVDDSISAMSNDTCWQDESQGVVELILPNVLFCDDRDNESTDNNSWKILFPSYVQECIENERDELEECEMRETGEVEDERRHQEEGELRVDSSPLQPMRTISRLSIKEKQNSVIDPLEAGHESEHPVQEIQDIQNSDEDMSTLSGYGTVGHEGNNEHITVSEIVTADEGRELSNLEDIINKQEEEVKAKAETTNEKEKIMEREECLEDSTEAVEFERARAQSEELIQQIKKSMEGKAQSDEVSEDTCIEKSLEEKSQSEKTMQETTKSLEEEIDEMTLSNEDRSIESHMESHGPPQSKVLRKTRSPKRSRTLSRSPRGKLLHNHLKRSCTSPSVPSRSTLQLPELGHHSKPTIEQQPTIPSAPPPGFFRTKRRNSVTKHSVHHSPVAPSRGLEEIDVRSDSSCSSMLTTPSVLCSAPPTPQPLLPPAGYLIPQLRTAPSSYPLYVPHMAGLGESTNIDSGKSIDSNSAERVPSVASTAGSFHERDLPLDTNTVENNTRGVFGGLWKRVLEIPSIISRRRLGQSEEEKEEHSEEESMEGSAIADDGVNSMSWAGMSLDSLAAWTDYQDSDDSTKWWEVGSELLLERSPCVNTLSGTEDLVENGNESIAGSCASSTTVYEDAVDRATDEEIFSTPKSQYDSKEQKTPHGFEDDPWLAAKRGDIDAIQQWVADKKDWDWSQVDDFGNTALFYACHSGAAMNIAIVKVMLDQWPVDQIPEDVMDRCKLNAINRSVVKMLENPDSAEDIIVAALSDLVLNEHGDDEESLHLRKWLLYDLEEGEEDETDGDTDY